MNRIFSLIGVIAYVLVMIISIVEFPWPVTAALTVLPALAITASAQSLFLLIPFATLHSGLYIPGIPGNFSLFQALAAVYIGKAVIDKAFHKKAHSSRRTTDVYCAAFIIFWIILLMYFRGTGMRILGSTDIGGSDYIQAIIALLFFLITRNTGSNRKAICWTGITLGGMSILPVLANAAFELSGGAIWHQLLFFRFGVTIGETSKALGEGRGARLAFLSPGVALMWVGVFSYGMKNKLLSKATWWPFSGLLALMAGFRGTVMSTFAFFTSYIFFTTKKRLLFVMALAVMGFMSLVIAIVFAKQLPFPIQRVIASIPGVEVEWQAKAQGMATMIWREGVWSLAVDDIDQYWFFGRGTTFNLATIPMMDKYKNDPYVAYVTGAFHQATLELLILYGGPALLACALMYFMFIKRGLRTVFKNKWHDPVLKNWAQCVVLYIAVRTVLSFSGGTSGELLTILPIWMALYNIIRNTDIQKSRKAAESGELKFPETKNRRKMLESQIAGGSLPAKL